MAKNKVEVVIRRSNLTDKNDERASYGSIKRKSISMKELIDEIADRKASDAVRLQLSQAAMEISDELLRKLADGYAVNVYNLGVLYPTVKGKIAPTAKPSEIAKQVDLGFTPSKLAKKAVSDFDIVRLDSVMAQHYITAISDASDKEGEYMKFSKDCVLRIRGKALKLYGDDAGVFLSKADRLGKPIGNRYECDVLDNTGRQTLAKLPINIEKGKWIVVFRTWLTAGGKVMKSAVEFYSEEFEIV